MRNSWQITAAILAGTVWGVMAASADTMALGRKDVQKVLQADYNDRDAAFGRRDLAATLAHYAPEFVGISSTGKTHDLKEERLDFQKTFVLPTRSSVTHSTIQAVTLTKDSTVATVRLHRHGTLILVNSQTQGSDVLTLDGIFSDTWIKRASGWLLTREQASSVRATMNGKPL